MRSLGKFFIFLHTTLVNREPLRVYGKRILEECVAIGTQSVNIMVIVSVFMGAVTAIQVAWNMLYMSSLVPRYLVGLTVRNMAVLELSPTVLAIVFAGKVGSNIAGKLGSMRISEQIDALEVMGINAASYLVLPKIVASVITYPLLVIISIFLTVYSGYLASTYIANIASEDYIQGLRMIFDPYSIRFALYKSISFAFLVSAISSYKGFYTFGGALAVGKSSTKAVTNSCIAILVADYLLTQMLLSTPPL